MPRRIPNRKIQIVVARLAQTGANKLTELAKSSGETASFIVGELIRQAEPKQFERGSNAGTS
jgi:hypothetical protein